MDSHPPQSASTNAPKLRQRHLVFLPHWVARAFWELLRARISFCGVEASDVARLNEESRAACNGRDVERARDNSVDRIAFIVPLLARHLPWRSDCLIQAMAAQRWLADKGHASEIRIGAKKPYDDGFEAHAWLVHQERVVTGGEIGDFAVLIGESGDGSGCESEASNSGVDQHHT